MNYDAYSRYILPWSPRDPVQVEESDYEVIEPEEPQWYELIV